MSEFILGSICLTTLIEKAKQGHSAFSKSPKEGKVYVNYAEWINDEPNEFGQHSSLLLSSKKELKETEGKIYIGNGKKFENKPVTASDLPQDNWQANVPVRETKPTTTTGSDISPKPTEDLPF